MSKILVVGVDAETFAKLKPILGRSSLEVDRFPRGRASLELTAAVPFDLLVVRSPLEDMELKEYLDAVRSPLSASRRGSLLLLVADGDVATAESYLGRGANRAVPLEQSAEALESAISQLLEVAPRIGARIFASLEIQLAEGKSLAMCQTENLSATGMLIRTNVGYPLGTRLDFEFALPMDPKPVSGEAEVVRHTLVGREAVTGVGARFVSFSGDGRARFERYLKQQAGTG
ncbi:MAG: PilZ domain-containing protein [Acidobacteria bacterium]|nr:PilZ domain-containing protein [Acidobacteriota bacterium]